jgi:hypothetical protein
MDRIKILFKESREQEMLMGADLLFQSITKKEIRNPEMRREVESMFIEYFTRLETTLYQNDNGINNAGGYLLNNIGIHQLPKIYRMCAKTLLTVSELNV